jgi:hypothetical protein
MLYRMLSAKSTGSWLTMETWVHRRRQRISEEYYSLCHTAVSRGHD